jgi:carbon monoxide dehydrogenase subunit G
MVSVSEQVEIDAQAGAVWAVVSDPLAVAECIPGATLAPGAAPNEYSGSIKVKFGPTAVIFNGLVTLGYDHASRHCTIEGRGRDSRGASNALASGTVRVAGERPALLTVDGTFDLSGPLEGFARTGGVHLTRALLADFARNVEARVAGPRSEGDAAPPAGDHLGGFSLMWQTLRSLLRGLLRGRTAP